MRFSRTFPLILLALFFNRVASQESLVDKYWYFGDSIGLYFGVDSVQVFDGPDSYGHESYASIATQSGTDVIYSSWNFNGTNTTDPYNSISASSCTVSPSDSILIHSSMTQGALILPAPSDSSLFYYFHLNVLFGGNNELRVSTLELTDTGCFIQQENDPVLPGVELLEKMYSIRHANGKDWWIMVHEIWRDVFWTILLNEEGYVVVRSDSMNMQYPVDRSEKIGQMKISPNGEKIAWVGYNGTVKVWSFDRCLGQVRGPLFELFTPNNMYYGCAFSRSGRYLYSSTLEKIYQHDLTRHSLTAGRVLLYEDTLSDYVIGQLQLAPDNKIYIANTYWIHDLTLDIRTRHNTHLSVIQNPDSAGLACGFEAYSFNLGGRICSLGLPNNPDFSIGPARVYRAQAGTDTSICKGQGLRIGGPPIEGVRYDWSSNSGLIIDRFNPNPWVDLDSSEIFYLFAEDTVGNSSCSSRFDTVEVTVIDSIEVALRPADDSSICWGDTIILFVESEQASFYQWIVNDTMLEVTEIDSLAVTVPGEYVLMAWNTDSELCPSNAGSIQVKIENFGELPEISTNSDTLLETENTATVYEWYLNDTLLFDSDSSQIQPQLEGSYYVVTVDTNGCRLRSETVYWSVSSIVNAGFSSVVLLPNPVNQYAVPFGLENKGNFVLYDTGGNELFTHEVINDKSPIRLEYPSGVYFWRIYSGLKYDKIVASGKVIIVN